MKKIEPFKIIGRNGHSCTLTKLKPKKYLISFVNPVARFGSDENGISFIDPSGGPFIGVGDALRNIHPKLPNKAIVSIERNESLLIITTE
jgi:hypothetical protein